MPKDDWLKLAILYDKTSLYSPSNNSAIDAFCEASIRHNIYPTIIGKDDINILDEFDFLFIRDTTHINNYTYEFATYMELLGKKTIDSTRTISQGCNKIWQWEMFRENRISHPKTWLDKYSKNRIYWDEEIVFPCVIKIPDSCFSRGVYKCNNIDEYKSKLKELSKITNSLLVCQEFIETTFDWRITIFNNKFLFAIKYYMVDKDWKIIKYDRKGNYIDGNHECIKLDDVPPHVLALAAKCNKFLTDGLYGIDIKEVGDKAYVIEVNDNANIDAGVEDEIEGENIYNTIITWFKSNS